MNTEIFTGKADAYAIARPGYPDAAFEYINSIVSPDAIFADVGAGTGKFTVSLSRYSYKVYAIEPNADMQRHLAVTLHQYPNVKIIDGSAEATTLPDHCVDVITCAQALHWFDLAAFMTECRRIGKPGVIVIAIYNITPGGSSVIHFKQSTEAFFNNPIIKEFANTMFYTRENWLTYMSSHAHNPLPADSGYAEHIAEVNRIFDNESVDGLLRSDVVTMVCSENI